MRKGVERTRRTKLGRFFSEGARQLWLICGAERTNPEGLRQRLGFGNGVVNRIMYGDTRPDLWSAYRIRDVLGIEPRLFLDGPLEKLRLPVRIGDTSTSVSDRRSALPRTARTPISRSSRKSRAAA